MSVITSLHVEKHKQVSYIRVSTLMTLLLSMLMLSCRNGTEVKKGSITGQMGIWGQNSSAGIQVVLFTEPDIANELSELPPAYHNLAVNVEAAHFFDHRNRPWLQKTLTDDLGRFSFSKVVYGRYVIAYLKEGLDVIYQFGVEVDSESMQVAPPNNISMQPVGLVPDVIDGNYVFESFRTYVVRNNLIALPSSKLDFRAGTMIFVDAGKDIVIYGNCEFPDPTSGIISVTCSDGMYQLSNSPQLFGKVELFSSFAGIEVSSLKLSYATEGLILKTNNISCRNSVFSNNEISCTAYMNSNVEILNNLFLRSSGVIRQGLAFFGALNATTRNNVFHNIQTAVVIEASRSIRMENNYFLGGDRQISMRSDSDSRITNNSFKGASIALVNTAKSNMEILHNDIDASTCIYTHHTGNAGNTINNGWTKANNNNFRYTRYAVEARGYFYTSLVYLGLDFKLNYWDTTSIPAIEAAIIDAVDLGVHPDENTLWPTIEFSPIRTTSNPNAGVILTR